MNIWESMQRGLEKASQEAGRIAKAQRLRSSIDNLTNQIKEQENLILVRTRQLYIAGTLTQPELVSICQSLAELHQQLLQLQREIQQLTAQPPSASLQLPPQTGAPSQPPPPPSGPYRNPDEDSTPTYVPPPPPPPYQSSATFPSSTPPPPPPSEPLTISARDTLLMPSNTPPPPPPPTVEPLTISARETLILPTNTPPPPPSPSPASAPSEPRQTQKCPRCEMPAAPDTSFCQHCGSSLHASEAPYQATSRASSTAIIMNSETIRASLPNPPKGEETVRAEETNSSFAPITTEHGEQEERDTEGQAESTPQEKVEGE